MSEETIYYYCSLKTLFKILNKKSIILTDMTRSNDADEFKFIFELYNKYLIEKYKENSLFISPSFNEIKKANTEIRPMARCFSTKRDDISMWRKYSCKEGVCIGFDLKGLEQCIANLTCLGKKIELKKIKYIDKNNFDEIKKLFDGFDKVYPVNNYSKLLELSLFYKNDSFSQEDEYRIGVNTYILSDKNNKEINLEFDETIGLFVRIPLDLSIITEIIVAPNNNDLENELIPILKYFSDEMNNLTTCVSQSSLTFRWK